jgi:hypothetical protein
MENHSGAGQKTSSFMIPIERHYFTLPVTGAPGRAFFYRTSLPRQASFPL